MEGLISNFCRNRHTASSNQMVVIVKDVTDKEAASKLVGKKVTYDTGKKKITGEIRSSHGNKGALRVLFETGMPGQAIGAKVSIQ